MKPTEITNLEERNCPFNKSNCLTSSCALYNQKLKNCAIHLIVNNLWKLEIAIGRLPVSPSYDGAFKLPGA